MALLQFCYVPPLRIPGLLVAAVLCSWVNPRTHCTQECEVDSQLELLVFQSPTSIFICRLSSCFFGSPSSVITLPLPISPSPQRFVACTVPFVLISMPILRQSMGCRRGGSRGRPIRQASSSSSDTSSCSSGFSIESHPATRRGCGRDQGNQALLSNSLHSHAYTTRFQIPCTLCNHSLIASVTIQLSEGAIGLVSATPNATTEPRVEELPGTSQYHSQQNKIPSGSASQDKPTLAHLSVPIEGGSPREEGHPSDDDDSSSFGCRIVEEVPSTTQDA